MAGHYAEQLVAGMLDKLKVSAEALRAAGRFFPLSTRGSMCPAPLQLS